MNELKTGAVLQNGKYRIERVLGQGGFGITYLATHVALGRKVAIKEFFMKELCNRDGATLRVSVPSTGSRDTVERFRAKFVKEAQTIAALDNPHIIRIHDVFGENGTAYYVMDYVGGGSLADIIRRDGPMPEDKALGFIRQIADALDYIHARRINHLDIKPSNILVGNSGQAVVIDFGLSKRYDATGSQTSSTPVGISHGYAPLEQYQPGGVSTFSPSTDIYSLGATLYKLLSATTPPNATTLLDTDLDMAPVAASPSTKAAIAAAMQPKRKDRPQTVEDFMGMMDCDETAIAKNRKHDCTDEQPATNDSVTVIDATPTETGKKEQNENKPKVTNVDNGDTDKSINFCTKRAIVALLVLWGLDYLGSKSIGFPTFFFTDNVRDWIVVLTVGIVLCIITNKMKTNRNVLTIARLLFFWLYFSNPPCTFTGSSIACFYSFPPLIILSIYAWGLDNGFGSAKDNFKKWRNSIKEAGLNYKHGMVAFVGIMALLYFSFHTFNEHPEYFGSIFDIINADIISVVAGALIFRCVYRGKSEAMVHLARYTVLLGIFIEGAGIQLVPTIVDDNPCLNMIWNIFPISASSIFMTLAVLSCLAFSIDLKRWKGRK